MERPTRGTAALLALLIVPSLLWVAAILFVFRVSPFFHAVLMKRVGPVIVLGAMSVFPLAAMILGIRRIRTRRAVVFGSLATAVSGVLLVAFLLVFAVPVVNKAIETPTPKNPSSPRPVPEQVGLPVFPGAEGFGTRTPAGRGGKVIEVTSLADHGPGTLRAALEEPGPRIIVFRVGGSVELESELSISRPLVTLAGQTAPGGGISIKNAGIVITTHDGMPDAWELRMGLDPNDPSDGNRDADGDGYTNVEEYLYDLPG